MFSKITSALSGSSSCGTIDNMPPIHHKRGYKSPLLAETLKSDRFYAFIMLPTPYHLVFAVLS